MMNSLLNGWSFSGEDVIELGFLGLSLQIIRCGEPQVRAEFTSWAGIGPKGPIRDAILFAFRDAAIDSESFMNCVHELYYNVRHHDGSFEELSSFRVPGRYEQWDRAVLRSIDWTNPKHLGWFENYVRSIDVLNYSQPLQDFLLLRGRGRTASDAADVAAWYSEEARKRELDLGKTLWQRLAALPRSSGGSQVNPYSRA
jgi:hypothetical protein